MRVETIGDATLYLGDCREIIPTLPRLDVVITSPPYNLGAAPWERLGHWKPGGIAGGRAKWKTGASGKAGVEYGAHADSMAWPEYVEWQRGTLSALWERLADTGAIFYNHKPRVIGTRVWTPFELMPAEAALRQILVWARPGGMNFNATAFVPTHEWIMVLAKSAFRLKSRGVSGLGDVWQMKPDKNEHPAPFPLELPTRVLDATLAPVVADPFMGSGTTGVACAMAARTFHGIELEPRYFDMACRRIESAYAQGRLFPESAPTVTDRTT